ncbi:unnamed protein product [Vicia faba]|uniref:Uncharacterized protein n=1 Tax=Vicia faba TaxID=3906 RepID=A0AAV0YL23_VICFA|nr:unnamed protein product [Vicia faba]
MSNLDNVIDLNVCENATLGIGEKIIVKGLMMPDRFILPGMDSSFDLKSFCLAEDRDKETLSHQFILSESYLMKCSIQLSAGCTIVIASDSSRDMRHVFLKGYLMVMSYNLAFTSNIVKYQYNKIASVKVRDRRFFDKEDYIMKNKVVVDSCYFTNEEMWVLVEMCDVYPKKRFGEPNIYNNLVLDKDDLLVFADNENVNFGSPPVYGNPERLWNNIVNIAIKMGVVDDLCEIVAGMRGLPYFLREANTLTGKSCFLLDFPLSYSPTLGLERVTTLPSMQGFIGHSGYYGSSKCLVADLQLGQMMLMSLFNIIEQLGAIGIIGVPSGNVRTDPFFQSSKGMGAQER